MTSIRGRTALAITCLERALAVNQVLGEPSLSPIVEALWGYVEREQYLWTDWLEQQPDLRPFRRSARGAREARERQGIGRLPPAILEMIGIILERLGPGGMYEGITDDEPYTYEAAIRVPALSQQLGVALPDPALFARVSPFDEAGGYGYPAPRSAFSPEALHRPSASPLLNRHPNARLHGAVYSGLDIAEQGRLGQLGAIMDAVLPLHADLAEVRGERTRRVDSMEELLTGMQEGWSEGSLDLQFCGPAPVCLDGSLAIHTSRVTGWARSSLHLACRLQSLLDEEGSLEALEQGFLRLCDAMAASYGAMDLVPIPDPFHSPAVPVFWLNYVGGGMADRVTHAFESLGAEMQRTEEGGLAARTFSTPLEQPMSS